MIFRNRGLGIQKFSVLFLLLTFFPFMRSQCQSLIISDDVADPVSLDPHFVFDNKTYNILNQIYEGLIKLDNDGKIVPSLAERWEKIDERSIRFYLRKGITFHNGEILNAYSVQDSIRRQLKLPSPVTGQLASIEDAVADSENSVIIQTHEPDAVLLYRLAVFSLIIP